MQKFDASWHRAVGPKMSVAGFSNEQDQSWPRLIAHKARTGMLAKATDVATQLCTMSVLNMNILSLMHTVDNSKFGSSLVCTPSPYFTTGAATRVRKGPLATSLGSTDCLTHLWSPCLQLDSVSFKNLGLDQCQHDYMQGSRCIFVPVVKLGKTPPKFPFAELSLLSDPME